METQVTFRHFNGQHPDLQDQALAHLDKLERFHDHIISGEVIFNNETHKNIELKVHVKSDTIVIKEEGDEFKKMIHDATDRMIRQLKKDKDKKSSH